MKIKPLLDKVVLEQLEAEQKTESGIYLPNMANEKPELAKVIAVGEGGFVDGAEVKMLVKPDDKVLFNKYAGSEYKLDGKKYIIIKQADILAIVEE